MDTGKGTLVALIVCAGAASASAQTWRISSTSQGVVTLNGAGVGAEELSGLTWAGGTQYYAVSDNGAKLFPLTIQVDGNTGTIVSSNVSPAIQLAAGSDVASDRRRAAAIFTGYQRSTLKPGMFGKLRSSRVTT